jgi:hypothetical protein
MKDKKLEQFMKDEFQKEINVQFAFACLNNDLETVRSYLNDGYIDDLAYEHGLFAVYAAMRGNIEVLNILYENPQKEELKKYQQNILVASANYGHSECVKFLLEHGANPVELQGTTAYNNYQEVEKLFNEHLHIENTVKTTGDHFISSDTHLD